MTSNFDNFSNLRDVIPARNPVAFAWVMRGNDRPPDPYAMTVAELDHALLVRRRRLLGQRRITPELEGIIRGAIEWACRSRACRVRDLAVCTSCVFLLIDSLRITHSDRGMHQAVRHVVTRRTRRLLHWPRGERVFRTLEICREIITPNTTPLPERLPRLVEL